MTDDLVALAAKIDRNHKPRSPERYADGKTTICARCDTQFPCNPARAAAALRAAEPVLQAAEAWAGANATNAAAIQRLQSTGKPQGGVRLPTTELLAAIAARRAALGEADQPAAPVTP